MQQFPINLGKSLETRKEQSSFRTLEAMEHLTDFSSNDYLGFARNEMIFDRTSEILQEKKLKVNGAGGSRLLTGNHVLYAIAEETVASFHSSPAALFFNSGYDANLGFFSSVPKRADVIFYDEFIHASIRDGINLSSARGYKFRHNDLQDLQEKYFRLKKTFSGEVYVVTESVFSMDGDSPDLNALISFANEQKVFLIIDEAHALGVFGRGLTNELQLEQKVFARIITFGKALGVHGAAVLGSNDLREYLINFSRSLIYTTALPPHSIAAILAAYESLDASPEIDRLSRRISFFKREVERLRLTGPFLEGNSAIQCCLLPGNAKVKKVSLEFRAKGFDVRPILSPTVPQGKERLRFCLHSYNSEEEISKVLELLTTFIT